MKRILPLLLVFAACSSAPEEQKKEAAVQTQVQLSPDQLAQLTVTTESPQQLAINRTIQGTAKVEVNANERIQVTSPFGGFVVSSNVIPGQQVKVGQVLGVIENPDYIVLQQDYLLAKNEFELLQKNAKRQEELAASKATSERNFEEVKSAEQSALIRMMGLKEKLNLLGIRADKLTPNTISSKVNVVAKNNGIVSAVNAAVGSYIAADAVWMSYVGTENPIAKIIIFEKDLPYLSVGQPVLLTDLMNASTTISSTIQYIQPTVDLNGKIEVICSLTGQSAVPGSVWNAEITTPNSIGWIVPKEAIIQFEKQNYIFIDKGNGVFEMTAVNLGYTNNTQAELLSADALKEAKIVVKGAYNIFMQLKNSSEE
jgi:cobalt-zinc-cadmium efflux system membrane fusion protein